MSQDLGELDTKLGVEILEASIGRVVGRMPVATNRQPFGRLHGGASLALGESLGSLAATLHAEPLGLAAVGVDINGTHHRGVRDGFVTGVATPVHLGRRTTTHEVVISDDAGSRICTVRITNQLIPMTED
ncbi:MAG: hotdog fold thioesterase [Bifidobacteriaceae bacterium]|nr:hotdog fold thioesterase [Bifidobacteriaceae bacterium]